MHFWISVNEKSAWMREWERARERQTDWTMNSGGVFSGQKKLTDWAEFNFIVLNWIQLIPNQIQLNWETKKLEKEKDGALEKHNGMLDATWT